MHLTEFTYTSFSHTPQGHFSEFTIIFPPLLPTIILDFPAFTFSPLSRRLVLYSVTRLPRCSIVGAINIKSSAYIDSEGRPLKTTSITTVDSVRTFDTNQPSCQNSLSPAFILTTVHASVYKAITVRMSHSSTLSFLRAISPPPSGLYQTSSLNLQKNSTASSLLGVSLVLDT